MKKVITSAAAVGLALTIGSAASESLERLNDECVGPNETACAAESSPPPDQPESERMEKVGERTVAPQLPPPPSMPTGHRFQWGYPEEPWQGFAAVMQTLPQMRRNTAPLAAGETTVPAGTPTHLSLVGR